MGELSAKQTERGSVRGEATLLSDLIVDFSCYVKTYMLHYYQANFLCLVILYLREQRDEITGCLLSDISIYLFENLA